MEIRFQKVTKFFSKKVSNFFMLPLEYFAVKSQEMAIPDF
jgi:hypothetical protein